MARQTIVRRSGIWEPAVTATAETKQILAVQAGWRVVHASFRHDTAAAATTDSTAELGDGDDTDGYIAAADLELRTAGTYSNGAGAYLATAGGKLYSVADTLDIKYTVPTAAGAVRPKIHWTVGLVQEWPH